MTKATLSSHYVFEIFSLIFVGRFQIERSLIFDNFVEGFGSF